MAASLPLDSWQRRRLPSPSIQRGSNVPLYSWQRRRKGDRRLRGRRPGRCTGRGGAGVEERCGAAIQLVNEMRPLPRPTTTVALSNLGGARSPSSFVTRQQRTIRLRVHPSDTVHAVKAKMEEQFSLVLCATGLCATPSSILLEQLCKICKGLDEAIPVQPCSRRKVEFIASYSPSFPFGHARVDAGWVWCASLRRARCASFPTPATSLSAAV